MIYLLKKVRDQFRTSVWKYTLVVLLACVILTGCRPSSPAPAAETASEDMTEASGQADTDDTAVEEIKLTPDTALAGICFSRDENGDNEILLNELRDALVLRGFLPENIIVKRKTGSRRTQEGQIDECLSEGCSLLIVSAVSNDRIPDIVDRVTGAGAQLILVNCRPDEEETARWISYNLPVVWIRTTYEQELACQMNILYDYSGTERGLDFNKDGHVGTLLVGGGDQVKDALKETMGDLGMKFEILDETDSEDAEEISSYMQEMLNTYRKEAELVICSSEDRAQAAADGVQMRHRLVGRDILVIGAGTHEDTCTAIINKLMSGSTFTDFYEQSKLTAVAARDMIEGNQPDKMINNVVFKVTEDNAQEVLDQLWKARNSGDEEDASQASTEHE